MKGKNCSSCGGLKIQRFEGANLFFQFVCLFAGNICWNFCFAIPEMKQKL